MSGNQSGGLGNIILGLFLIVLGICLALYTSSMQSDYDQYCTGLVGIFVEIGSDGQCTDLKNAILVTAIGTAISEITGIVLLVLGLVQNNQNQSQMIILPMNTQNQYPNMVQGNPQQYQNQFNTQMSFQMVPNYNICKLCGTANHSARKNCGSCKNRIV